jgi:thioredoxin 1
MNSNRTITEATFEAEVLQSTQPVLVVFGTPWSRPCQVLDPILQELTREGAGKVKVVSVNADNSLDLSLCYDIQSIPTLLYFVKGKLRDRHQRHTETARHSPPTEPTAIQEFFPDELEPNDAQAKHLHESLTPV